MHILQATSEFFPYSKTGGLADMVAGLSKALAKLGHKVTVITPLYRGVRKSLPDLEPVSRPFRLRMGNGLVSGRFYRHRVDEALMVYFVDQHDYFGRNGIYMENGEGYWDNPDRFIFFSKAVVRLAQALDAPPDVLHCHDWHTGLIPLLLQDKTNQPIQTCLTIHNLAYQGICSSDKFQLTNLPKDYFSSSEDLNFLKVGLVSAGKLTTVSPSYAAEITTSQFGEGLEGVLLNRRNHLHGILNGADYSEWRTTDNPHIPHDYSRENLEGKGRNKSSFISEQKLYTPGLKTAPLFSFIGRLADQKGVHLLLDTLRAWLPDTPVYFMLLGTGDSRLENECRRLERDFPRQVRMFIEYDEALAHRIKAASDFFVMPSKFEPCGLNQIYSLRYGAIPLVHSVGGLTDTIIDIDKNPKSGNGFVFSQHKQVFFIEALNRAIRLYNNSKKLSKVRNMGMKANFNWEKSAQAYANLYSQS